MSSGEGDKRINRGKHGARIYQPLAPAAIRQKERQSGVPKKKNASKRKDGKTKEVMRFTHPRPFRKTALGDRSKKPGAPNWWPYTKLIHERVKFFEKD